MEFKDLLDYCKAQAISYSLDSTELSVWRSMCRTYSKTFYTPLHEVFEMDPDAVMTAVFEEQLEALDIDKDLEQILDTIYALEDPEYENQKRVELDDFIEKAEAEETQRLKDGKPIHPSMKKEFSLQDLPETPKPASGGVNLSYLEKEENSLGQFEE